MNKEKIILIGGGGHCKSVIEIIESENKFKIAGLVDTKEKLNIEVSGYKILWNDDEIETLVKQNYNFIITLGFIRSADLRAKLFNKLLSLNAHMPAIISPIALVSKRAVIGKGTVVMHQAHINSGAKVGSNCIINSKALLEHDVEVGANCHISTNAVINGETKIGDAVFIGSGSVINNNLIIGSNIIIGSGSVVTKSLPHAGTFAGNPLRAIHKK